MNLDGVKGNVPNFRPTPGKSPYRTYKVLLHFRV
jgi:hypothetical protein